MSENLEPVDALEKQESKPLPKPWYRQLDFWIGLGLFFFVSIGFGLLGGGISLLTAVLPKYAFELGVLSTIVSCLPYLVLLGMTIYFFIRRRWVALGLLAGFAFSLLLALVLGLLVMIACFFIGDPGAAALVG